MMASGIMAAALLSLILLLPLIAVSAHPQMWNIDCGSADGFLETAYNLTWVGDGDYVKAGVSREIANPAGILQRLTTLRAFPKNKKNCYTIPVGADTKIWVRVAFYYGNYDGLEKPPSFELLLDDNDWAQVDTEMDQAVSYTVIYSAARESTNICVGRLYDDQEPFVSSIQVIACAPEMYSKVNSSFVLYKPHAYALGANSSFRNPYDVYDRYWYTIDEDIKISSNNSLLIKATTLNTSTCADHPPAKLFETAVTPVGVGGSRNLTITPSYRSSFRSQIYLNMYFTEANATITTPKRKFDIYMDDEIISDASTPIAPNFGEAIEFTYVTFEPKVSNATVFTLVPTNDSTLPPIISGFETLYMYGFSSDGTDPQDVAPLEILQNKFKVLQNWTGDPCLPETYNWEWVNCSSEASPHISMLSLGGYGLSGKLPDFSGLVALESIDLSNNMLSGDIPGFLARFPKLKNLNLAYNNFSGDPASLITSRQIRVNVTGNPLLEKKEAPPPSGNPYEMQKDGSGKVSSTSFVAVLWALMIVAAVA